MIFPRLTLEEACAALREGRAVIYPTETFYALGCDAMNPDAVGLIFSIKRRALHLPLPVIISRREDLNTVAAFVSETAFNVMEAFWPGPLSVILPARPEVPDLLTAGAGRIAVRYSPHPAPAVLREDCGLILSASSANLSGGASVAVPADLAPELAPGVAGIFEHGPAPHGGLPSSVLDVVDGRDGPVVRILRPGAISAEALRSAGFAVEEMEKDHRTL